MSYYDRAVYFNVLEGKTLTKINGKSSDDVLQFIVSDTESYTMDHDQDCCEQVRIEDICGDLDDLIGYPILQAEEVSNECEPSGYEYAESYTWTFYKIATIKGSVTIRWLGESNGYYSESVSFNKDYYEA